MGGSSSYVYMDDEKWYRDPILADETKTWFVHFPADRPPEFLGLRANFISLDEVRYALKDADLSAEVEAVCKVDFRHWTALFDSEPVWRDGGPHPNQRIGTSTYKTTFCAVVFNKRPPAARVVRHGGIVKTIPVGAGPCYDFDLVKEGSDETSPS